MAIHEAHVLRARRAEQTVLVVVRPGCVLHHDGRTYGESELLRLSLDELDSLEEHGVVERRD